MCEFVKVCKSSRKVYRGERLDLWFPDNKILQSSNLKI